MQEHGYRLPTHAQHLIETCHTLPDFLYQEQEVAIYIDGPSHDYPERGAGHTAQEECLGDMGFMVLRFGAKDDWEVILAKYPHIFGVKRRNRSVVMDYSVGTMVRARGREWVVLPSADDQLLRVRPLGGTEDEVTGIYLPLEPVEMARFAPPDASQLGDDRSCRLLRNAVRLGFRSSAGPFRSFANIAVEPRPYQLVPLLMALKLSPVRLLIADDVGIGKTVEAGLIARELLDRGEVERIAVLCPPQLVEQWQEELRDKFHLDAEAVLPSTICST